MSASIEDTAVEILHAVEKPTEQDFGTSQL